MRAFCTHLRGRGIRLLNHLDDFLFFPGCNRAAALVLQAYIMAEFAAAGFTINLDKSQLDLVTRLICLGYVVDTVAGTFEVPLDRWQR